MIGYLALSIVGVSAALNFLAYSFGVYPSMTRICMAASPMIGVGGWSALVAATQGIASPFIPGLWLEIVLSAMGLRLRSVTVVTVAAIAGLWLSQLWIGVDGVLRNLVVQSGFMMGMGLATLLVTRRWIQRQTSMLQESEQLGRKVHGLTRELEDERTVAALGEKVARLAHGIKNAVHSLRGFSSLVEARVVGQPEARAALEGLRSAIDDLESLARTTLASEGVGVEGSPRQAGEQASPDAGKRAAAGVLSPAIQRAIDDIRIAHPKVNWEIISEGFSPELSLSDSSLTETLTILLRNAVEAMKGEGEGRVESRVVNGRFILTIMDEGGGLAPEELGEVFKPGFTTKEEGSGYGLFLARRIVEQHGGTISASASPEGGASFEINLPTPG